MANASERSSLAGVVRGIRTVIRLPGRFLAYLMKATGRAYNQNYYPGVGGDLVDDGAAGSCPQRRRKKVRRRR